MPSIICGKSLVFNVVKYTNRIIELYLVQKNQHYKKLLPKTIKIFVKNLDFFDKLSKNHQGIAALVKDFNYNDLTIINSFGNNSLVLVLDQIQDPHNLGAIIRVAAAASVNAIIISKRNQVQVTSTVEKIAQGATCHIPIIKISNVAQVLEKMKKLNYWVVGTSIQNAYNYQSFSYQNKKIILVVGAEGKGIRKLILNKCDYVVKIPMAAKINSLNVSVATGILCYYIQHSKNNLKEVN